MSRVPYVYPPTGESPIADAIRNRRKNGELIPLDGAVLNAPEIAAGCNSFIGAVRNKNSINGGLRELLILRVAALNGAAYEWKAHEPVGRNEGLTTAELREIRNVDVIGYGPGWKLNDEKVETRLKHSALSAIQLVALDFADASTRAIKVPDSVFARLKDELGKGLSHQLAAENLTKEDLDKKINQQIVEVVATVGGYNLVSRFLVALDVGGMANNDVPLPSD